MKSNRTTASDLQDLREKSFLEPNLWSRNGKLDFEARINLLRIAKDFFDGLGLIKSALVDVQLTGSLASLSWSKHSDLDLHIILDFRKIPADQDISERYFDAIKNLWNEQHQVMIKGYEVEMYVEDMDKQHVSNGLYSLIKGSWLEIPIKEPIRSYEDLDVISKADRWMSMVEQEVFEPFSLGDYDRSVKSASRISKKFKKWRKCGLDSSGINSVENLAYKLLRRKKYLAGIRVLSKVAYDQMVSVDLLR